MSNGKTPTADLTKIRQWRKQSGANEVLISTSTDLLDRGFINDAFATDDMYWAKPLPQDQLELLLQQSLTLGMYIVRPSFPPATPVDSPSSPRTPSPTLESPEGSEEKVEQIGMARLVTDYVTLVYLTDVYLLPECRKDGLGKWMVASCKEVIEATPEMRRSLLFASPDVGRRFYERELGWTEVGEEKSLCCMTLKGWGFGKGES